MCCLVIKRCAVGYTCPRKKELVFRVLANERRRSADDFIRNTIGMYPEVRDIPGRIHTIGLCYKNRLQNETVRKTHFHCQVDKSVFPSVIVQHFVGKLIGVSQ